MKKNKKNASLWAILFILTISSVGYWVMASHSSTPEPSFVQVKSNPKEDFSSAPLLIKSHSRKIAVRHAHKKQEVVAKSTAPRVDNSKHVDIVSLDKNAKHSDLGPVDSSIFQAGSAEIKLSKELPAISWGARIESMGANANLFFDASHFSTQFSDNLSGLTRFSLGMVQQNGSSALTFKLGELLFFKTDLPSINPYVGIDLNLPLSSGGSLGYGLFAGVERELSLFGLKSERGFVELGYNSYTTSGLTNSGFSFDLGYRFSF